MPNYQVKLACGNCCSERLYEIERGVPVVDSELICPNCGCSPVDQNFVIFTKAKPDGKATRKEEKE